MAIFFLLVSSQYATAQAGSKIAFVSNRDGNNEIYIMNPDGTDQVNLTNNLADDNDPAFSPDGAKILFRSDRGGNTDIYLMNADGSDPINLTNDVDLDSSPRFSPDGSRIIFGSRGTGLSDVYAMDIDGSNRVNLTNDPDSDGSPQFSPDGSKIVFTSRRDGNLEIYIMDADGSNPTRLTNNLLFDGEATFSPDGSKIAFTSQRDGIGNDEVYVMNADGTDQTSITNSAAIEEDPGFSPDGSKIAFRLGDGTGFSVIAVMDPDGSNRVVVSTTQGEKPTWSVAADSDGDGVADFRDNCPSFYNPEKIAFRSDVSGNFDIYVVNADGTERTRLTDDPAGDSEPVFSPNASKIAFSSTRDGDAEIYLMDADGSNQIRLTDVPGIDSTPAFSPDGSQVVFKSTRNNLDGEIYLMNIDGTGQVNLTNHSGDDGEPGFSPDGTKIIFSSFRNGSRDIYVMDIDGSNQIPLTNNPSFDSGPTVSPDGSKIAFVTDRDGDNEIYVMNADGSNQVRLTNDVAFDVEPTFSPDGSRIGFRSDRDGISNIYIMNADGSDPIQLTSDTVHNVTPSWGSQIDSNENGIGDVCENTAPTIVTFPVSVGADSSANVLVAQVSDIEDAAVDLVVVNGGGSSSNGVTVSNLQVDALGNVTADLSADCGASDTVFGLIATDSGNMMATASVSVTVTPETTAPVFDPIDDVVVYLPSNTTGVSTAVNFPLPTASDNCDTNVSVMTSPVSGSAFPVGMTTVNVDAIDDSGNMATTTFTVTVLFDFAGFFQPVNNFPALNSVKAGQAVPLKFSLSGNKGLDILSGLPTSSQIQCDASEPGPVIEETLSAGGSSLSYDFAADQYSYIWKTNKAWKETCRILVVKLDDGSEHLAKFRFK
jgi:Tol biopolymer transport system component